LLTLQKNYAIPQTLSNATANIIAHLHIIARQIVIIKLVLPADAAKNSLY